MKLAIGSEAIFFLAFILGYLHFWDQGNFQLQASTQLSASKSALYTGLLILSSVTFIVAEKTFNERKYNRSLWWMLCTILLGVIFLGGQGIEYYELIQHNISLSTGVFGTAFFALTGFHGLHVIIGLIIMIYLCWLIKYDYPGKQNSTIISTAGIYWHFVDIVWICVFTTIYLLPFLI